MQKTKIILALLLVAALTIAQLPVTALAASAGEGGEIIAFDTLPEETANQTVALGTSLEDLNLPNTLNATVRVVAEDTEAPEPETTEINIPIPVEWASSPDYDGEKAGAYIFNAQVSGYTLNADLPEIAITVGKAAPILAALAGAVCNVNGVDYTDSIRAIRDAFENGGTLTLLQDIDCNEPVDLLATRTLEVNLNGYTLNINSKLQAFSDSTLNLVGEGENAHLNINGAAVVLQNKAKARVSNIYSPDGYAAELANFCSLTVSGDARGDEKGVWINGSKSSLHIGGDLIVTNASYGIDARFSTGTSENSIMIGGDLCVTGSRPVGVYATDITTTINGGIYLQGAPESIAIKMGIEPSKTFSLGEGTYNSGTGYFEYTFYNSKVHVKGHALTVAAGTGGTVTPDSGPFEGGRVVNLSATPANIHSAFNNWTSVGGGTFTDSNAASTTFIMPSTDTTVTANFTFANTLPTLKSGVQTEASASVTLGDTYTLDLSDIFTDTDEDPLKYKVSLNGVGAVYIEDSSSYSSLYTYTPTELGTTTHKFLAHDDYNGYTDNNNKYKVTLTANKKTPTAADLTYSLANKTYNGLAQSLNVTGPSGLGTMTVKYNGSATAPRDATTYAVTVSIAEGTNYAATTADITLGDYTIAKAPLTITGGAAAAKTYDGTTSAALSAITFDGLQNSETLAIGTDYTVTEAAFDSADAGSDKTVTGAVMLAGSGTAKNYTLSSTGLNLTGQSISKAAAPTGVDQMLEVVKNHSQDYPFDLTTLLPAISSPKSLGTVAYVPSITANGDGVLGSLNYTSGDTLTIPVNPVAAADKTATIKVTVKSTNYADFDTVITVKTIDADTTAPTLTGPTAMTLAEGYGATSTGDYTITGTEPVEVTKTSGDSKITWNDATKKLDIAAGLTPGSYPVILTASNGTSPDATLTFTLTVSSVDEDGCLVTYKGAQARHNGDTNTYDIRFIAIINTLNAKEVGFVFSKTQAIPTRENASEKATSTVYTQITASGSPVTAKSLGGQYIIACTVTEILESDIKVPLYVRAFSTVGTATKYTPVTTVTVKDLID
ncbi:YDG domain-containing protein [Desulfoscipio sp. XC116]|uniref:InlB B-repeat-containing protein n=1 Tax=Desulfoscipio sp. XC116 TaxID=3144975 RepID=UPI00325ABA1C